MSTAWWQRGVIYQIYPRSFLDTDGDGVGDLQGIRQRLDYLTWLGVDAVWISPFYPSPMADFGYDVSDYTGVDPRFGTLHDFDALVAEAHARGLQVILDYVPNHTSRRHPWFVESRAGRASPRRDWYLWRDPAPDGGPPNNWLSVFGGSAWAWDEVSGQYYYHAFLDAQPDLNWRNPEVRRAMYDVLRFWLDRGVDGFRVDVIWHLIKDDQLRDNPPNLHYRPGQPPYARHNPVFTVDRPEIHDLIAEMRAVVDEYDDRLLIGEIYLPIERLVRYYGVDLGGVHLPFNFQLVLCRWEAASIAALIEEYEAALPAGGWPNWVLGNHDNHRIASRFGAPQARTAAMLLLTLRGTPTLYYGDELGMRDVPIAPERVQDPYEKQVPGLGVGRDPARTPMQWDASAHAGFTRGEPWLPVADDVTTVNVAAQRDDPDSLLSLYRRLTHLRRREPALTRGGWRLVRGHGNTLAYLRQHGSSRLLVALNLGAGPVDVPVPTAAAVPGTVLLGTHRGREGERVEQSLELSANEGLVVRLA